MQERVDGLDQIRLIDRAGESAHIDFPEAAYAVGLGNNPEFQTRVPAPELHLDGHPRYGL